MKNILITGENGYIGMYVERYLSRWPERYRVSTLSVRGEKWKERSFRGYDAILHAAGIVHQSKTKDDPEQFPLYHRVNGLLSAAVAEKARAEGVRLFLFMSTESVYGLTAKVGQTVVITKDTPLEPKDNYGKSKLEAEKLLQALAGEDFLVAILRPPMIYGRGCKGNYAALSRLAQKTPVFPKVRNRRSMLYIENFAAFVKLLIDEPRGGVFCPQDREYVDVGEMARRIARVHGKKLILLPGFSWALKLLSPWVSAVDKAFGSLVYDRALSDALGPYWVRDPEAAIAETEGRLEQEGSD